MELERQKIKMMELNQTLNRIDTVLAKQDQMGKLPQDVLKKINYKFRLDWNYYSNRMEGGTLTRQETRSVMVGNINVQGKPITDVMEMHGHDEVVRQILNIGKGKTRISEKRLKVVHKAIIKETDDTEKNKQIGKWKEKPNEIINYKNEKISFTAPVDVPDEIHELLNQTNAKLDAFFNKKKQSEHPLIIAADFHLGFVSIHPFFDGNGRSARIFMNLILISCGYPPIIIDDDSKEAYYQTLGDIQAYGGKTDTFHELMANLLLKSVELVTDAVEGKDIEDDDDLDKRLKLLENISVNDSENAIRINLGLLDTPKFYNENIQPLFKTLQLKFKKIEPLFADTNISLRFNKQSIEVSDYGEFLQCLEECFGFSSKALESINVIFYHKQFTKAGLQAFNIEWRLHITFEDAKYQLKTEFSSHNIKLEKLYHQGLTDADIKMLIENYLRSCLDKIEENIEKLKNDK